MAVILGNAGVLRPGRSRPVRVIGWMIVLFVALVLAVSIGFAAIGVAELIDAGQPPGIKAALAVTGGWAVAPVLAGLALMIAAYCWMVRIGEHRPAVEFAPARAPLELGVGLAIGIGLIALTVGTLWLTGWARVAPTPITAILPAINDTLRSSVAEETLFRLVIFRLLWRAIGAWPALAASALLFGGLHLINPHASPFAALCIALEAGVMLAAFYILSGRIWLSVGVHAGWNFTQGWVFGAAVSGGSGFAGGPMTTTAMPSVPAMLSGGDFGPEASLPALLLCLATGLIVLRLTWRRGSFRPAD